MNIDEDTKKQKLATVPFLLNLASLSQTLLKAMTDDVLQTCEFLYLNHYYKLHNSVLC